MKKIICGFIALFCILILSGCGPSLKDYVRQSKSYNNRVAATTSATVNIESRNVVRTHGMGRTLGTMGTMVNTASKVAAAAISSEQRQRLNNIIVPENIGLATNDGFNTSFEGTTHIKAIDSDSNPDLRIMLTIKDYGLWAASLVDPIQFFVEAEIQVVYTPEMKTIYTNGVTLSSQVSNIVSDMANAATMDIYVSGHLSRTQYATFGAINNAGRLARGAANLSAFFELTDEEIAVLFDYLSYEMGTTLGTHLVHAIYY